MTQTASDTAETPPTTEAEAPAPESRPPAAEPDAEPEPAPAPESVASSERIDFSEAGVEFFKAMHKAQGMIGTVEKLGKNTQADYAYATAEDMIRATRAPNRESGLMIMHVANIKPLGHAVDRSAGQWQEAWLVIEGAVVHCESGQKVSFRVTAPIICSGRTPPNKGKAASDSYEYGFVLRNLYNIDRENEGPQAVDQQEYEGYGQSRGGNRNGGGGGTLVTRDQQRQRDDKPANSSSPPKAKAPTWADGQRAIGEASTAFRAKCEELGMAEPDRDELKQISAEVMGLKCWPRQPPQPSFLIDAAKALMSEVPKIAPPGFEDDPPASDEKGDEVSPDTTVELDDEQTATQGETGA